MSRKRHTFRGTLKGNSRNVEVWLNMTENFLNFRKFPFSQLWSIFLAEKSVLGTSKPTFEYQDSHAAYIRVLGSKLLFQVWFFHHNDANLSNKRFYTHVTFYCRCRGLPVPGIHTGINRRLALPFVSLLEAIVQAVYCCFCCFVLLLSLLLLLIVLELSDFWQINSRSPLLATDHQLGSNWTSPVAFAAEVREVLVTFWANCSKVLLASLIGYLDLVVKVSGRTGTDPRQVIDF